MRKAEIKLYLHYFIEKVKLYPEIGQQLEKLRIIRIVELWFGFVLNQVTMFRH